MEKITVGVERERGPGGTKGKEKWPKRTENINTIARVLVRIRKTISGGEFVQNEKNKEQKEGKNDWKRSGEDPKESERNTPRETNFAMSI